MADDDWRHRRAEELFGAAPLGGSIDDVLPRPAVRPARRPAAAPPFRRPDDLVAAPAAPPPLPPVALPSAGAALPAAAADRAPLMTPARRATPLWRIVVAALLVAQAAAIVWLLATRRPPPVVRTMPVAAAAAAPKPVAPPPALPRRDTAAAPLPTPSPTLPSVAPDRDLPPQPRHDTPRALQDATPRTAQDDTPRRLRNDTPRAARHDDAAAQVAPTARDRIAAAAPPPPPSKAGHLAAHGTPLDARAPARRTTATEPATDFVTRRAIPEAAAPPLAAAAPAGDACPPREGPQSRTPCANPTLEALDRDIATTTARLAVGSDAGIAAQASRGVARFDRRRDHCDGRDACLVRVASARLGELRQLEATAASPPLPVCMPDEYRRHPVHCRESRLRVQRPSFIIR